jgi:large subunit ribosomal protein L1
MATKKVEGTEKKVVKTPSAAKPQTTKKVVKKTVKKVTAVVKTPVVAKTGKVKKLSGKGSKAHKANLSVIKTLGEVVSVEDAVKTLLSLTHPKFKNGVSVELQMKLNINPTKSDQLIRTSMSLPHGNGKTVKVAAFVTPDNEKVAKAAGADIIGGDELIEEIKKSGKIDFDAAVAEPEMMKKMAPIARVLGTAGVMPSPKNDTVGTDVTAMVKLIKSGKFDVKNDKQGNVHIVIGRINKDFDAVKLVENLVAAMDAIEKAKPEAVKKKLVASAFISATMSPSIKIA